VQDRHLLDCVLVQPGSGLHMRICLADLGKPSLLSHGALVRSARSPWCATQRLPQRALTNPISQSRRRCLDYISARAEGCAGRMMECCREGGFSNAWGPAKGCEGCTSFVSCNLHRASQLSLVKTSFVGKQGCVYRQQNGSEAINLADAYASKRRA